MWSGLSRPQRSHFTLQGEPRRPHRVKSTMRKNRLWNHQRGRGFLIPSAAFDASASPAGGLLVGSPQEMVDKLLAYHDLYGANRALVHIGFGGMPHKEHLEVIERLGADVAPVVRREVAAREGKAA